MCCSIQMEHFIVERESSFDETQNNWGCINYKLHDGANTATGDGGEGKGLDQGDGNLMTIPVIQETRFAYLGRSMNQIFMTKKLAVQQS